MSKFVAPRCEPLPYYMSAMGMQGARFVEGDPSGGVPTPTPVDDPAPPADPVPPVPKPAPPASAVEPTPVPPVDDLGDGGKKALDAERTARKQAEKDKATADTAVVAKDAEITTLSTTVSERDQTITEKDAEIAVLKLAVTHRLSSDDDMDLLRSVSDATKRASLAERLAQDSKDVFRKSGLPGPTSTSGSLDAGRERYNAEHNKSQNS